MSSIAMAADSTQSELKDSLKGKKHKKAISKKKKVKAARRRRRANDDDDSNSDCDSDMDLAKELRSIGGYLQDHELTVEHMFRSISGKKLKTMLPEILKPIPVNELKKLCIEQLECMSKKRIRRILEGADPDTISSTGTEEDSSLDEDDKDKDDSSDHERQDDRASCSDRKDSEQPTEVATAPSDISRSPDPFASRSRSRSPVSSRSGSPGYGSDNSMDTSERSFKNAESPASEQQRCTENSASESSAEEIVEEVVYEEVVLEDGDDLEAILGHGSFLKGTKDARLKTVASHRDDVYDESDDVMMIEREEREEQSEGIHMEKDDGHGMVTPKTQNRANKQADIAGEGRSVKLATEGNSFGELDPELPGNDSINSTMRDSRDGRYPLDRLNDVTSVRSAGDACTAGDASHMDTDSRTSPGYVEESRLSTPGDVMEGEEYTSGQELEEGEIEDSSSEDEQVTVEETVEERSDGEKGKRSTALTDQDQQVLLGAKDRGKAKKKVRVIKRIIKVIRKKPKLDGQSAPGTPREVAKKLRRAGHTKNRREADVPESCMNVKINTEPGLEQGTCLLSKSPVSAKSTPTSAGETKVKKEPALASSLERADLTSVSEKSLNQMEILELEMRARAIKAMLKKQEEREKRERPQEQKRIKLKRKLTEN